MMFLPDKKDAVHKAWLYRVLAKIADDNYLSSVLYFKGGTCAAMRGLLNRFSVDLDFDFMADKSEIPKARKQLEQIFTDLGLKIKDQSSVTLQYFLSYPANSLQKKQRTSLKIDSFFPPLAANKYEPVRLVDIDRIIYCQTIETMFANKLIALIDRYKQGKSIAARDLYDIHHYFLQGFDYDREIVENYAQTDSLTFMKELCSFVEQKITQRMIDQDLNFLLSPKKFQQIRKILKTETLMFLRAEGK
ncbi:MAG TPA: nucleotidyl transferase AbiEii/AbiGii toxin family protein [Trueperaceae bacterium]|nr:nucleotidyl transferase AbiEii/AbiGii toxin family protein [Trueperaceae bacterium]